MNKKQLYREYLKWLPKGVEPVEREEMFNLPVANYDVYEDDDIVINNLHYLVCHALEERCLIFTFYEKNIFYKNCGNQKLIYSLLKIPKME